MYVYYVIYNFIHLHIIPTQLFPLTLRLNLVQLYCILLAVYVLLFCIIIKQLTQERTGTANRRTVKLFVFFKNSLASVLYNIAATIPNKHAFTMKLVSIAFRRPDLLNTSKDKQVDTIKVINIMIPTIKYRMFTSIA